MIRQLQETLSQRLEDIPGLLVVSEYDQRVPNGSDGTVQPYVRVWPSIPGRNPLQEDLSGNPGVGQWQFQITCAGGTPDKASWAARKVLGVLTPKVRLLPSTGYIRADLVPALAIEDTTTKPTRWYYPLVFSTQIP